MSKFYALIAVVAFVTPAAAADVTVETINKTFEQVLSDPAKVTAYCAMSKKMDEVGDDEKKAEAASAEIDGYLKTLGTDFEATWNGAGEAKEDSPEAKAFDDQMNKLDEKCGGGKPPQ